MPDSSKFPTVAGLSMGLWIGTGSHDVTAAQGRGEEPFKALLAHPSSLRFNPPLVQSFTSGYCWSLIQGQEGIFYAQLPD